MKNLLFACVCSVFAMVSCKKDDDTPPVVTVPPPTVSSISPTTGPKNTVVTITGTNFGTSTAALKVYFNGVQGTVQTATDTQLTVTVPAGASTGAVKVEKNSVQVTGPVFTYQGNGTVMTMNITGISTLSNPSGITRDAAGNLFVCDRDNHRIVKITPGGAATVFVTPI